MMAEVMETAPPSLFQGLHLIQAGDYTGAQVYLTNIIPMIREGSPDWLGSLLCSIASCRKNLGDHKNAVIFATMGKESGLNIFGFWHYYEVMAHSLNQLERLEEALDMSNEAIGYWRQFGPAYESEAASIMSAKSNVLKQLAIRERDDKNIDRAKELILEAIRTICESLSYDSFGWEIEIGEKELYYLGKIAREVGITPEDVRFVEENDSVREIVSEHFGPARFE
jgi:tetratricopeptide (TPR) repeat protein